MEEHVVFDNTDVVREERWVIELFYNHSTHILNSLIQRQQELTNEGIKTCQVRATVIV